MSNDTQREAFEAIAPDFKITIERFKNDPDTYKYEHSSFMFRFWKAAWDAALSAAKAAQAEPDTVRVPKVAQDAFHAWVFNNLRSDSKSFQRDRTLAKSAFQAGLAAAAVEQAQSAKE